MCVLPVRESVSARAFVIFIICCALTCVSVVTERVNPIEREREFVCVRACVSMLLCKGIHVRS